MIEQLKQIARDGGAMIREALGDVRHVRFKGEVDLVTVTDVAVEEYCIPRLAALLPGYTIVGEESFEGGALPAKGIYIDPIDGTTNFVHGMPFVGLSIGVWDEAGGIAGVVYNPVLDEMYWAVRGGGAWLGDTRLSVSQRPVLREALIATGFPYTKTQRGEDYHWTVQTLAAILPVTRDVRRLGAASLDLCYLARGIFDGYYEINLKPWDVAAGILIVQEAGGRVCGDGEEYRLGDKLIVAANGVLFDDLRRAVKGV